MMDQPPKNPGAQAWMIDDKLEEHFEQNTEWKRAKLKYLKALYAFAKDVDSNGIDMKSDLQAKLEKEVVSTKDVLKNIEDGLEKKFREEQGW